MNIINYWIGNHILKFLFAIMQLYKKEERKEEIMCGNGGYTKAFNIDGMTFSIIFLIFV